MFTIIIIVLVIIIYIITIVLILINSYYLSFFRQRQGNSAASLSSLWPAMETSRELEAIHGGCTLDKVQHPLRLW